MALTLAGADEEAVAECATACSPPPKPPTIPTLQSYAPRWRTGIARRDADPVAATKSNVAASPSLKTAATGRSSTYIAVSLARLSAIHGDDPAEALDFLTLAIRNHHDSGSFSLLHPRWRSSAPSSTGSAPRTRRYHQRIRRHSPHRTCSIPRSPTAIAHLREVLGDDDYESLARTGRNMTNAAMVTYAFEQIDLAGRNSHERADRGSCTFLFTDIEGSTRRWEADADAMRAALAAHDEVLREAIDGHGGWLFKHTGDGVCAAFASPRAAVDAAVAAQRALELPVRMGIATGEAELRGGDYFGAVLNRAARVMAAGHGGQILLDGATAGLLTGVDLIALGPRRLRDIAKPVDVFQVRADGLRTDFPPLKTLDRGAGKSAAADDELRRARGGARRVGDGAQGAPVGDADRRRRGRQDTAGAWRSPRGRRATSPTGCG